MCHWPCTHMLRYLVNLLLHLLPPSRLFALRRALWRGAGVDVAVQARICGGGWIYGPGEVRIGPDTWLSPGVTIYSHPSAAVMIGARCDLGHEVTILTGSHEIGAGDRRAGIGTFGAVTIGDGCWIGARTVILCGVSIGEGSVIGAGSVVTHDIPPNRMAAGVPAVTKRELT